MQPPPLDPFDIRPTAARNQLNILPQHVEEEVEGAVKRGRFPSWLHRRLPQGDVLQKTREVTEQGHLHTVCVQARCPNRLECHARKTATFLVLGGSCTRSCAFCSIPFQQAPPPPSPEEPAQLVESVKQLGLKHVVLTMVARDDLLDGGALHLRLCVEALKEAIPGVTIELLTSDFLGNEAAWHEVLQAKPEIWNYNIETVRSLTPRVRHKATYDRTLALLRFAKANMTHGWVKSGFMVGFGESEAEVHETIQDLYEAGCAIITIGQYLQSDRKKRPVKAFIPPAVFDAYAAFGSSIGVPHMYCGPLIRSSYNADLVLNALKGGS